MGRFRHHSVHLCLWTYLNVVQASVIVAKMLLRPAHKVPTDRTPKPEPGSGRKSAPTGKGTRSPATDMPEWGKQPGKMVRSKEGVKTQQKLGQRYRPPFNPSYRESGPHKGSNQQWATESANSIPRFLLSR